MDIFQLFSSLKTIYLIEGNLFAKLAFTILIIAVFLCISLFIRLFISDFWLLLERGFEYFAEWLFNLLKRIEKTLFPKSGWKRWGVIVFISIILGLMFFLGRKVIITSYFFIKAEIIKEATLKKERKKSLEERLSSLEKEVSDLKKTR